MFSSYSRRELLIASFAGVRGAITLAGVLSIPLFLSNGNPFPARYELVFIATGVILFSLLVGVIILPVLLRGVETLDKNAHRHEIRKRHIQTVLTVRLR
ncbi:putative Na(+)/H(+) exchanger protein [Pantoea stewartii subsp. stewartii DC283]|uniref:Putative Na(+)/H(+) exchanger protein n=1 Tax=Pantoea stewartii subsp. stewartii DC283 TaxID=660596 RepID=H3RJ97_PANSE|nr:putative Na(+)/H(+) exchanger protein [Pantoea stewartii subsp. stewartii DC283]